MKVYRPQITIWGHCAYGTNVPFVDRNRLGASNTNYILIDADKILLGMQLRYERDSKKK